MPNVSPEYHLENEAILAHWADEALKDFPDHAQRAQGIINHLLKTHDPEKWKIYTFQKQEKYAGFPTLGIAHYFIAQILFKYEEMDKELDADFRKLCMAHLHLLPPDDNIPPWVNPHD